jgi:hypothetical protein
MPVSGSRRSPVGFGIEEGECGFQIVQFQQSLRMVSWTRSTQLLDRATRGVLSRPMQSSASGPGPRAPGASDVQRHLDDGRAAHPLLGLGLSWSGPQSRLGRAAARQVGRLVVSPNGIWRMLRRHGLSTRAARLGLVGGDAAGEPPSTAPVRGPSHQGGEPRSPGADGLICIGRLSGSKGVLWQLQRHRRAELVRVRRAPRHGQAPLGHMDLRARSASRL